MARSYVSSTVKRLPTKMTYSAAKQACADEDMIIWMPDNLVDQNKLAKELNFQPGDEVWLRLTFEGVEGAAGKHPSCKENGCTVDNCCCNDQTKCKYNELDDWDNVPGENGVGEWLMDWKNTNSLTPTDPSPMMLGFSYSSTMRPLSWDNSDIWNLATPPTCRTPPLYYHWATGEPKNFKAIGKFHRNPTDEEKENIYAVYSHSHSGIGATSKDVNGDWVSKSATDTAIVLCQTRDFWRHYMLKRCQYEPRDEPTQDLKDQYGITR